MIFEKPRSTQRRTSKAKKTSAAAAACVKPCSIHSNPKGIKRTGGQESRNCSFCLVPSSQNQQVPLGCVLKGPTHWGELPDPENFARAQNGAPVVSSNSAPWSLDRLQSDTHFGLKITGYPHKKTGHNVWRAVFLRLGPDKKHHPDVSRLPLLRAISQDTDLPSGFDGAGQAGCEHWGERGASKCKRGDMGGPT